MSRLSTGHGNSALTSSSLAVTKHKVDVTQIDAVLCHRRHPDRESKDAQYLVRWKAPSAADADKPLSWHDSGELTYCLEILQTYIENFKQKRPTGNTASLKRKRSQDDGLEHAHTLKTARTSSTPRHDREESVSSLDSTSSNGKASRKPTKQTTDIYNAVIKRRDGTAYAKPSFSSGIARIDATTIPNEQMRFEASNIDTIIAEMQIRQAYLAKLNAIRGPTIRFINTVDRQTPSLAFKFIDKTTFHSTATSHNNEEIVTACTCNTKTLQNGGCETPNQCECLEFAEPNPDAMSDAKRAEWKRRLEEHGVDADRTDMPKSTFYYPTGHSKGLLLDFYLGGRHMLYECNDRCPCGPSCPNRNVQHGRKVGLEIFKTRDGRGFGLRTTQAVSRGQFVDTYRGEIISDAEATAREDAMDISAAHYLFALDKYVDGDTIRKSDCLVVDGIDMGSPTRFVNHSCEPNMQMHTVSMSKYDRHVYELAFFAGRDIPAGTELTFDYMERDDVATAVAAAGNVDQLDGADGPMSSQAQGHHAKVKAVCRCGASKCRGYLWD